MKKFWGIAITALLLVLVLINAFILFEYLSNQKVEEQNKCRCCCCCCDCDENDEGYCCCERCDEDGQDCSECCCCCCCCKKSDESKDLETDKTGEESEQKEASSEEGGGNAPKSRGYMAYVLSKTTSDLSQISNIETSGDIQENSEFSIAVTQDSDEVLEQITDIYEFVSDNKTAPIRYFNEETVQKIAAMLPEGTDLDGLSLNEFVTVETCGCDETHEHGQAHVHFKLATKYEDTQNAVALVGIFSGGGSDEKLAAEWIPLKSKIIGGELEVEFDLETLEKMNDKKCAFAVFNTPTE
jgi:hypothetical protein